VKVTQFTGSSAANEPCNANAVSIVGIDGSSPTQTWDTIPSGSTATFKVKITMADWADNDCAAKSLDLPYTATVVSQPS